MYFRYLARELRRRARSASVVAIGLAVGVGLVITVNAASSGVDAAQGQVLRSLYGVGTDITVTKTPTVGSGGPFRFGSTPSSRSQAGQTFNRNRLTSAGGLGTIDGSRLATIAKMTGVAGATGALSLDSTSVSGTFSGGAGSSSSSSSSTPFSISTFTVQGVDADDPGLGPLSASNISSGTKVVRSWFERVAKGDSGAQELALVNRSYAKQNSIKAGSKISIHGTSVTVLGLVTLAQSAASSDVYLSLSEAQTLASLGGKVNTIYVTASSSTEISKVQSEIQKLLPGATVTTAADLASEVTGSLSTASSLASSLGVWLAAAVLLVAFVLAALLTAGSVSRRVREFGTLKAIGWRTRRIVGQVLGESLVQGLVGAVLGLGLGLLGAFLVTKFAPTVQATANPGAASPSGAGGFGRGGFGGGSFGGGGGGFGGSGSPSSTARHNFAHTFASNAHTVTLHLTAPISLEVVLVAIALAIAGGLVAGLVGGWRAARLQPAEALRRIE